MGRFTSPTCRRAVYRLRAHATDHADGRLRLEVHAGEALNRSVRLAHAEIPDGTGGRPQRTAHPGRARAGLVVRQNPAERPREATSDDAGRFVLGGLTRGLHRLIAEAPGFGSVEQGPVQIPAAAPVLRMETDGNTITGVVNRRWLARGRRARRDRRARTWRRRG